VCRATKWSHPRTAPASVLHSTQRVVLRRAHTTSQQLHPCHSITCPHEQNVDPHQPRVHPPPRRSRHRCAQQPRSRKRDGKQRPLASLSRSVTSTVPLKGVNCVREKGEYIYIKGHVRSLRLRRRMTGVSNIRYSPDSSLLMGQSRVTVCHTSFFPPKDYYDTQCIGYPEPACSR
jgi:hypothetical protein